MLRQTSLNISFDAERKFSAHFILGTCISGHYEVHFNIA